MFFLFFISLIEKRCPNLFSSASRIVDIIKVPGKGVAGVAFGGDLRKTLYITVGKTILNFQNGSISDQVTHGTSVYAVNGLEAAGSKSTHLEYKICSTRF